MLKEQLLLQIRQSGAAEQNALLFHALAEGSELPKITLEDQAVVRSNLFEALIRCVCQTRTN